MGCWGENLGWPSARQVLTYSSSHVETFLKKQFGNLQQLKLQMYSLTHIFHISETPPPVVPYSIICNSKDDK